MEGRQQGRAVLLLAQGGDAARVASHKVDMRARISQRSASTGKINFVGSLGDVEVPGLPALRLMLEGKYLPHLITNSRALWGSNSAPREGRKSNKRKKEEEGKRSNLLTVGHLCCDGVCCQRAITSETPP